MSLASSLRLSKSRCKLASARRLRRTQPRFNFLVEHLEERRLLAIDMVTNNLDDGSAGTLRSVIFNAASGDTIEFAAGISQIDLTQWGQIEIDKSLTISLPGASQVTIDQTTAGGGRVFQVDATDVDSNPITVLMFRLTLTGGNDIGGFGGAIYNQGSLYLDAMTLSGNSAGFGGGGIGNYYGTVNVIDSTLSGNSTENYGGGIYNAYGVTTVVDSTLSGNSAGAGGGIDNLGGTSTVTDSTLSRNSAIVGGGIDNVSGGTANIANTIIAGNSVINSGSDPDVSGDYATTDHDLIGIVGDATGFTTSGANASLVGTSASPIDPGLAPLGNYGGPTQTMVALRGSPAVNAGDPAPASPFAESPTDQRGLPRLNNGKIDVGATELTSTFTVSYATDSSLRQAICDVNDDPNDQISSPDVINFDIGGSGVQTISPLSPLPAITRPVVVDGWSQGGTGYSGSPLIQLDGSNAGDPFTGLGGGDTGANGLIVSGGNSQVCGLAVSNFSGFGIYLDVTNTGKDTVEGCYIGTDASDTMGEGNGLAGVEIFGSHGGNRIGVNGNDANAVAERNVISGNGGGVGIEGDGSVPSESNTVAGNYIGTDVTGMHALGNSGDGVDIAGWENNLIGWNGTDADPAAERNVISGNSSIGIDIEQGSDNTVVAGNYIGTNATGTCALGNLGGIQIIYSTNNCWIGTKGLDGPDDAFEGNVISGNTADGIYADGVADLHVAGNFIGTNACGTCALGDGATSVYLVDGLNDFIGAYGQGTAVDERNIISGGGDGVGVRLEGSTTGTTIAGNYIGTDVTGEQALGNAVGVYIINAGGNNQIGTDLAGDDAAEDRNVISGNSGLGVYVAGTDEVGSNVIAGNYIGTDQTGTPILGTSEWGILLADNGGSDQVLNNVVSGATYAELEISAGSNDKITANTIGPNAAGTVVPGNQYGILVDGTASNEQIGGPSPALGNVVAGNSVGILVFRDPVATGISMRENLIYDNGFGIDLGDNGVVLNDSLGHNGPNNFQNFPVLTAAYLLPGGGTFVEGTLESTPCTTFQVDLFSNPAVDASGYGQGETLQDTITVHTDSSGIGTFMDTLGTSLGVGQVISATATDPAGDTSEFSADRPVTSGPHNFMVLTTNDSGGGSLRQAILDVNADANSGQDTITFDVAGGGVQTISPLSTLPTITQPVLIDGYTQPGSSANTHARTDADPTDNAVLNIVLDGSQAGASFDGLVVAGGDSTVEGLQIQYFVNGIHLTTQGGDTVQGNTIENAAAGVLVDGVGNDTLGGSAAGDVNVISGNSGVGLQISGDGNQILGNLIGTDASGANPLPNNIGVSISGSSNTIGGTAAGAGNVISSNSGVGLQISGNGNQVLANLIGTDATGTNPLPNNIGVEISGSENVIGGTAAGASNTIADNQGIGVWLPTATPGGSNPTQDSIERNSIYGNGGLGIALGGTRVTLNDSPLGHIGPNNFQNFPVLTAAYTSGSSTVVQGTLQSTPDTTFEVDLYSLPTFDPTGYGQGHYLDKVCVTTSDSGYGLFYTNVAAMPVGQVITATATDTAPDTSQFGDTSEFSVDRPVTSGQMSTGPQPFVVSNTNDSGPGSLRQAILNVDTDPNSGTDTIDFDILASGVQTISPLSPLPPVLQRVFIDGWSQGGQGYTGSPLIQIDGGQVEAGQNGASAGLVIAGGLSTVQGLWVQNFAIGIDLTIQGGDKVQGNTVENNGFYNSSVARGLGALTDESGVQIDDVPNNTIGGTMPVDRNLFVDNAIEVSILDAGATDNHVEGNYINTDGTSLLSSADAGLLATDKNAGAGCGVVILDASGNYVGVAGAGNVIVNPNNSQWFSSSGIDVLIWGRAIPGIGATTANNNDVEGNYLDTDASGMTYLTGIDGPTSMAIMGPSSGDTIDGNIMEGDVRGNAPGSEIKGNYMGTDASGAPLPGAGFNLGLNGATIKYNTISGYVQLFSNEQFLHNSITGLSNDTTGQPVVFVTGTDNSIQDNRISGGSGFGLDVQGSNNVEIGGTAVGDGNTIFGNSGGGGGGVEITGSGNSLLGNTINDNQGVGVWVPTTAPDGSNPTNDSIEGNSIYANTGLGIDRGNDADGNPDTSPSTNTPGAALNFPVLTSATTTGSGTTVTGTFNSTPGDSFRIEFFSNSTLDPSGYVQGQTFLGFANVTTGPDGNVISSDDGSAVITTDGSGNVSFTVTQLPSLPAGQGVITATATDLTSGDTSEFSNDMAVPLTGRISEPTISGQTVSLNLTALDPTDPTGTLTYTIDWGNGSTTTSTAAANAAVTVSSPSSYTAGPYEVQVTVNDGLTSSPTAATALIVISTAPSDTIYVTSTIASALFSPTDLVFVAGDGGSDTYTVDFSNTLTVPITVAGGGSDTLTVFGSSDPNTTNYIAKNTAGSHTITWGPSAGPATETVNYAGIVPINIFGGAGTNFITDPGTNTTIYGGPGANTITITATSGNGVVINGGPGSNTYIVDLGSLAGPVAINNTNPTASDSLVVNGAAGNNTLDVSASGVQAGTQAVIIAAPLAAVTVNTGSGNNQVNVSNLGSTVQNLAVNGGSGNNVVTLNNLGASSAAIAVDGGTGSTQLQVVGTPPPQIAVQNLVATVNAGPNATIVAGSLFTGNGSFTDPNVGDTVTATIDYGDGSGAQPLTLNADDTFALGHVYPHAASYTVSVAVFDGHGSPSTGTLVVTVNQDGTTTATSSSAATSTYGQAITLTAAVAADAGSGTPRGTVTFVDTTTGTSLGSAALSVVGTSDQATITTSALPAGTQTIAMTYDGTSDYGTSFVNSTIHVIPATLTVTANNANRLYLAANPAFTDTITGFVNGDTSSVVRGAAGLTTAATTGSPAGTYPIIVAQGSLSAANYTFAFVNGTLTVTAGGSIYVLNSSASGALTISGNAAIKLPGVLVVDSTSATAIQASGNATLNATTIEVVGGYKASGNASASPKPITGAATVADPLAGLPSPSTAGLTNFGSLSLGGNSSKTINPGIYSQISVSGNASLTMNAGTYIIQGGGLTVSGNASLSGTGVFVFNAGSGYSNNSGVATDGGNFGGITLSGNGKFNLSAVTTGPYAGIVIDQARDNTRALSLGGNATTGITSTVYAANALLTVSGNAQLTGSAVVGTLNLSGNVAMTQMAAGSDGAGDVAGVADTLLAGNLDVYVDNSNGLFTADELSRINDAIGAWNTLLVAYSVSVVQVNDPSLANIVIDIGTTSASGDAAEGVLGCYNGAAGEITLLQGWNWYAGSDPAQIGADQYDFQTTVTHEVGHALGLGGASDTASPMYESLATGVTHRTVSVADLNIPETPEGADPQMAAGFAEVDSVGPSAALTPALSQDERERGSTASSSANQASQYLNGLAERELLFGSMGMGSHDQDMPVPLNLANGVASAADVEALSNGELLTNQTAIEPHVDDWLGAVAFRAIASGRVNKSGSSPTTFEAGEMSGPSENARSQHMQAETEDRERDAFFASVVGATADIEADDSGALPLACAVDNGVLIGLGAVFLAAVVRQRTDRPDTVTRRTWSHRRRQEGSR